MKIGRGTTNNFRRRAAYKYTCSICQKKRFSFVFSRAIENICSKCRRNQAPDNQPSLFPTVEPAKSVEDFADKFRALAHR